MVPDDGNRQSLEHRGCRLSYRVQGSGPPVLWIQGTGIHGDGWQPQIEPLSTAYHCLSFDNRGMGRSQPRGEELSVELMAEDAVAILDAMRWDAVHVVGHSLGGSIALEVALSARARVRSLALLCTFATGSEATRPTAWTIWTGLRSRIGTRRMRRHAFLEMVMTPEDLAGADAEALAARFAPLFGHDLADQPPVVLPQLLAVRRYDASPRLGELAGLPTLVVSGERDRIAPPALGRALAAGIPGARYLELPGAAHGVPLYRAGEINAILAGHFAGAAPGT